MKFEILNSGIGCPLSVWIMILIEDFS